jgi:hypothetical protein
MLIISRETYKNEKRNPQRLHVKALKFFKSIRSPNSPLRGGGKMLEVSVRPSAVRN